MTPISRLWFHPQIFPDDILKIVKAFAVIALIAIVLGGGAVFWFSRRSSLLSSPSSSSSLPAVTDAVPVTSSPSAGGQYVIYSPADFAAASNQRRVLYFYANWCPICRPADREFQQKASQLPPDAIVFRVNYNDSDTDQTEKDLAAKYNITYQHTFVQVDADGNPVAVWSGGSLAELLQNLK